MTREEQLACLKDRPCDVCKMRTDKGCNSWECVFEQTPDEEQEPCDCISRQAVLACKQTFHDNAGYETEYVDIDDIKALPSIQPKTDVLDKIRAEIEEQKECRCFDDDDMCIYRTGLDDALYIIDKYKAEKE